MQGDHKYAVPYASSSPPYYSVPECSGEEYDPRTHICCTENLLAKPADWSDVRCCMLNVYNPTTQYCCIDSQGRTRPAPKVPFRYRGFRCYEPDALDKSPKL